MPATIGIDHGAVGGYDHGDGEYETARLLKISRSHKRDLIESHCDSHLVVAIRIWRRNPLAAVRKFTTKNHEFHCDFLILASWKDSRFSAIGICESHYRSRLWWSWRQFRPLISSAIVVKTMPVVNLVVRGRNGNWQIWEGGKRRKRENEGLWVFLGFILIIYLNYAIY